VDKKLLESNIPEEQEDSSEDQEQTGFEVMSESFGTGLNQKVLLVTKGVSFNKIVKYSS
jgi:hypothetical protein